MLKITLSITALFVILGLASVRGEILSYDDPDCIVDANLDPEEMENYVDCNTPEAIAEKRTRCCDIEGEKGCCTTETKNMVMVTIGTTMAAITIAVMTACFVVFWCHPDTCPCLRKCPCQCCHRGSKEFSEEMTDLSEDIKKAGLANQAYVRENINDVYAPPEKYDMPEELKEKVQDDWWGGGASPTAF